MESLKNCQHSRPEYQISDIVTPLSVLTSIQLLSNIFSSEWWSIHHTITYHIPTSILYNSNDQFERILLLRRLSFSHFLKTWAIGLFSAVWRRLSQSKPSDVGQSGVFWLLRWANQRSKEGRKKFLRRSWYFADEKSLIVGGVSQSRLWGEGGG